MEASERVRVVQQDGNVGASVDGDVAQRWVDEGHAVRVGSKRKLRCIRLTVPIAALAGDDQEVVGRPSTALGLGVSFVEREHLDSGHYIYRHKRGVRSKRYMMAGLATVRSVIVEGPELSR